MLGRKGAMWHLRELDATLKDWGRYRSISLGDLKWDGDKRDGVLHAMLVSIQSIIDIANHLIVKKKLRKPAT
ncbi:MAG: DUF86 domain-containing protein [Methanosarcinales archaeon Met12]|nr:MAG: DUF86 domain-containing protein [Methanosarcinales archaeon Met12]